MELRIWQVVVRLRGQKQKHQLPCQNIRQATYIPKRGGIFDAATCLSMMIAANGQRKW